MSHRGVHESQEKGYLLSIPGKGMGLAPSCLSRASSISNL